MSATIKDVAKAAGVSPSTVSRVLNNNAPISEATRERIFAAMEELKYVPNDIARSFASGSAKAIAIAINVADAQAYSNSFFNNTVFGIETAAHRNGYNLIVTGANDERGGTHSIEKLVMSKKIDGLVLPVSMLQPSMLKFIADNAFPCVILGRLGDNCSNISWVDIANAQAGAASVEHLLCAGYRKPAFVSAGEEELFNRDRLEGYTSALRAAGTGDSEMCIIHALPGLEDAKRCMEELLTRPDAPDCVICGSDVLAVAALRTAEKHHLRVPEDFGILCFDNTAVTELSEPDISAVDVDTFELGRLAAENLFCLIEKPESGAKQSRLTTRIIERQSTAKQLQKNPLTEVMH